MIGTDIVKIERIDDAIKRGAIMSLFCDEELEYYAANGKKSESLAGLFAAKEAVIKAAGAGIVGVRLSEIQILHHKSGQPYVRIVGDAKKKLAGDFSVSISHDGEYAIAVAIINDLKALTRH